MKPLFTVKHCPTCNARARCLDSRPSLGGTIRRRYGCDCGRRWTTMEIYQEQFLRMPGRGLVLSALADVERMIAVLRRRLDPPDE